MIKQYRKKPIIIEAIEFTRSNTSDVTQFVGQTLTYTFPADDDPTGKVTVIIPTLEGEMLATEGDFIIKGVNGEFYPCKPAIFWKTYEEVAFETTDINRLAEQLAVKKAALNELLSN